jgi:peptidoglycan/LPS O-acetylase OafA/YrhL
MRYPALDGLRALAALLVIVSHASPVPGGEGVRLFFVLSGFLITGILARSLETGEPWTVWKAFIVRRALRIFPLAYLALTVVWFLDPASRAHIPWYAAYLGNFHLLWPGHTDTTLGHFWSLAIEEHFYLVWPILLCVLPRRTWPGVILGLLVVVAALRAETMTTLGGYAAYHLTWTRIDALALGGWLMLCQPSLGMVALSALALAVGSGVLPEAAAYSVREVAFNALAGWVVLAVARGKAPWLAWRPLMFLGTISYGLYVWHPIARTVLQLPTDMNLPQFWQMVVATLLLSVVSWYLVEQPILKLKDRWPYLRPDAVDGDGRRIPRHEAVNAV